VKEPSADLPESSTVARLGRRPLLRKPMLRKDSGPATAILGAAIRVHRFFEPV
jgi:hypothetical protein